MAKYGSMYSGLGGRRSREHPDETVQRQWHSDMKRQQQKNLSWKQEQPQLGTSGPDPSWVQGTGSVSAEFGQLGNYGGHSERQVPQALRDAAENYRRASGAQQPTAAAPARRNIKLKLRAGGNAPQSFRSNLKKKKNERMMNTLGVNR